VLGCRPGARRESIETYVKRLARIEEIAGAKNGVEKVFASSPAERCGSWCNPLKWTTWRPR
jgi:hypothetical protein